MFWCVISVYVCTSCAVFWRARSRANTSNKIYLLSEFANFDVSDGRWREQFFKAFSEIIWNRTDITFYWNLIMDNNASFDALDGRPKCFQIVTSTLTAVITFVSFSAFVGNILVTIAFFKNATLRTCPNYFIVNMAVSDLFSSLTVWPLYATEGMLSKKHLIDEPMATVVCKLGQYSRSVSQLVSIVSLVLIVVERFIAIVHPFQVKKFTKRLRAVLLILTWIISLLVAIPFIPFSKIVQQGEQMFCRFAWGKKELSIYTPIGFVLFYCGPLITITVLYTRIMKCLRHSRPTACEAQESTKIRNRQQNLTVMRVFISIVIVFFLCWTPLCVYVLLKMVFPPVYTKDSCLRIAGFFFYIFPSLGTAINPVILFVSSTNFSKALKEMLNRFKCSSSCLKCRQGSIQADVIELTE